MDFDKIRTRAQLIRRNFIENMDNFLLEFEEKSKKRGINIGWIPDEDTLVRELVRFSESINYAKFFIDTNHFDIFGKIKHQKPQAKQVSIEEFEASQNNPDFVVVKGDFGVVENGNVFLLDSPIQNSINQLSHLFIVLDINNIVLKQEDLDLLLFLKYGQKMTKDVKIISSKLQILRHDSIQSSLQQNDIDDVTVTVLLYDNGVTALLKDPELRQMLYCIDCNLCKNCCPVYQTTQTFSPKELVINFMNPDQIRNKTIFEYTTLCGNCDKICPVNIPLKELIIKEIALSNAYKGFRDKSNDLFKIFSKRSKMNKVNSGLRRYLFLQKFFGKNKTLYNYFSNQKEPFFNISQQEELTDE
jgi:L-lactate utilization protein LutB